MVADTRPCDVVRYELLRIGKPSVDIYVKERNFDIITLRMSVLQSLTVFSVQRR